MKEKDHKFQDNLEYTVQGPLGSYSKNLSQNISRNGKNGRKEEREERREGRKNNRGVKGKEKIKLLEVCSIA